jgi:6-phosphogluconolactonase
MVKETLLANIPEDERPEENGVDTELASPEDGAKAYEKVIQKIEGISEGQIPELDIVLLGMGEDGHFASIFPGNQQLEGRAGGSSTKAGSICCVTEHPEDGSQRVSLTVDTVLNAKNIFFIIKGENKAEMLYRALEQECSPLEVPASIFRAYPDKVRWFVDAAAAHRITDQ